MRRFFGISLIMGLFLITCEIKRQPIQIGHDECHFCSMKIMDNKFAAQIVTQTGKAYKYDATECMIRHLKTFDEEPPLILVMDYMEPGTFLNAKEAVFLVSEDIKSPMGANLSVFKNEEAIASLNKSGAIFDWRSIQDHLN